MFPALCGDCDNSGVRDGIVCRPPGLCTVPDIDRDGVGDDCDNCPFVFNPDQDSAVCALIKGVCPGGVVSDILWGSTPVGGTDYKPCPAPSIGTATRVCGVSDVWEEVNIMGCLSLTGQYFLHLVGV